MHLYRDVYIFISALFNSAHNFRLLCHLIYMYMHLRENFSHTCICILEKISLTQALWCYMLDCPPVCVQKHLICILEKKNQNGYTNHDHAVDCININWHLKCTTFIHQMNNYNLSYFLNTFKSLCLIWSKVASDQ